MSKDSPPRIHTLRNDGQTPKTSDCFTPRTMEGTNGAFKTPKYGSCIEGPYRSQEVWAGRITWGIIMLIIFLGLTILWFRV